MVLAWTPFNRLLAMADGCVEFRIDIVRRRDARHDSRITVRARLLWHHVECYRPRANPYAALFDRANPRQVLRTQAIVVNVPVRRLGMPEDVAHAAAWLMDDRSGLVTGQVIYVCGGMTVGVAGV